VGIGRADQKKDSSRRHFDRWARRYERDTVSRWLGTLQEAALEALALESGDRLLDVGCGTGAAVRLAAPAVERAVGVDLSPAMVARGRELAAGIRNVELREGDAEALPFEDAAFTAVLCTTSLHHYPRPERAVAEIARVLAPGGRAAIGDWTTDRVAVRVFDLVLRRLQPSHVGCLRAGDIERLLTAAGLREPQTRSLFDGAYAIVSARKPELGTAAGSSA
jgi:ubiquinone/menaquinone biosynthesis C-methylase UbiE